MINIGDDVTVSGKVVDVVNYSGSIHHILVEMPSSIKFYIYDVSDIKTHRPNTKEGE